MKDNDLSFQQRGDGNIKLSYYDLFRKADIHCVKTGEQFDCLKEYKFLADQLEKLRKDVAVADCAKAQFDRCERSNSGRDFHCSDIDVWLFLERNAIEPNQIPEIHFDLHKKYYELQKQLHEIEKSDAALRLVGHLRRLESTKSNLPTPAKDAQVPQLSQPPPKKDSFFSVVRVFVTLLFIAAAFYVGTEYRASDMISLSDANAQITAAEQSSYQDGFKAGEDYGYNSGYSKGYNAAKNAGSSNWTVTYNGGSNTQEQTVYVTDTGSKYHRAGCSYLISSNAISLSDALARGYTACSRCNP